jgi:hypothetical protein
MSILYIPNKLEIKDITVFYICFVFRCIIEIGHKRQNKDSAL